MEPNLPKPRSLDDASERPVVVSWMHGRAVRGREDPAVFLPAVSGCAIGLLSLTVLFQSSHDRSWKWQCSTGSGRFRLHSAQLAGCLVPLQLSSHADRRRGQVDVFPPQPEHLALT
jgi:hypothetical protein